MDKDILIRLFRNLCGSDPETIVPIAGEGSNRRYFRLWNRYGGSLIGAIGTNLDENRAFVGIDRHFVAKGLPVPEVLAVSDDEMAYLQTDLGDLSLFKAIAEGRDMGRFSDEEVELLERAMRMLPHVQAEGGDGLDFSLCFPVREFDRRSVMWDLNYFKYCFLKATGIEFSEPLLEDEFSRLADLLLQAYARQRADIFMVRDFQSRNVMLTSDGQPCLIDFQGGRRGPALYDVASFLWQAKANIPGSLKAHLAAVYLAEAATLMPWLAEGSYFDEMLPIFAIFRMVQTLGAYGFRGEFERKAHFLESIPAALANLAGLLDGYRHLFPHLADCVARAASLERYQPVKPHDGLMVRVMSFSYKKGLPFDPSGNGGGFFFDCRSIHNPGRYDRYKLLSGRDKEVIDFLVENGDAAEFLRHCYALVDTAVERYLKRGFTDLMVAFGCTGGRHRSVYCAEAMARHLASRYPVIVDLNHREQCIHEVIVNNQ